MSNEWVMVPREPTGAMFSASSFQEWDTFEQEWRAMLYAAPAAPQQAEPTTNDRVNLAYKNGYEECLNDCIRNGGEAWARSMFADQGEHIKPQEQAEPVAWAVFDPSGEVVYAALYKIRCVEYADNEYRYGHSAAKNWVVRPVFAHPPAAEVQRLREALKPFAAIDLTTNQAVDAMDVLRARRALEGK